MRILFILLFFIFLISFGSCLDLSISPPQINFNSLINEESCRQITISATKDSILIGEDRWAKEGIIERKFSLHTLSAKDLNLEVNYQKKFVSQNSNKLNICMKAKNQGFYHGLLLYKTQNSPAGVGIWINANITKSEVFSIQKLTSNITNSKINKVTVSLSLLPLLSLLLLLILLIKLRTKKMKLM